jgi:hypothetical protein
MKDNNKQPKAKAINISSQEQEQPEQPKEEQTQEEFVRVSDSRSGLHISLGSTTAKVQELLPMTLWLKDNWNRNPTDKTDRSSYLG